MDHKNKQPNKTPNPKKDLSQIRAEVHQARANSIHGSDIIPWLKENNADKLRPGEHVSYHLKGFITDSMIRSITESLNEDGWQFEFHDDGQDGRYFKFFGRVQ